MKFGAEGPFFKQNHEKSVLSFPENSGEKTAHLCEGTDLLVRALSQDNIGRFMFLRRYKLINSWANPINNQAVGYGESLLSSECFIALYALKFAVCDNSDKNTSHLCPEKWPQGCT